MRLEVRRALSHKRRSFVGEAKMTSGRLCFASPFLTGTPGTRPGCGNGSEFVRTTSCEARKGRRTANVVPTVPTRVISRMTAEASDTSETGTEIGTGIEYGRIQHAGVLVRDTEASKRFYMDVLGMSDDTALRNTKLPFAGAFVRAGASQIHLMELPNPDPLDGRPEHGGRDRHVAVTIKNLDPLIDSLEKHEWTFTFSKSGRRAVFLRDLDSNAIEFMEDPNA